MFPYTPALSEREVITFMRGVGASTRTSVPRTGNTLPEYATKPWAQPPAALVFHAREAGLQYPLLRYSVAPFDTYPLTYNAWYSIMSEMYGVLLGFDERHLPQVHPARLAVHECILLDKIAGRLHALGLPRTRTVATVALFDGYRDYLLSLSRPTRDNFEDRQALYQKLPTQFDVIAQLAASSFTTAQQIECLRRQVPAAELAPYLTGRIPFTLLRDLYPLAQEDRLQPV